MGMYDRLYDSAGREWQTKAYACMLDRFQIGEPMPGASGGGFYDGPVDPLPDSYQVAVLGGAISAWDRDRDAFATVRDHVLVEVPAERDESLPLVDYCGGPAMGGEWR